MLKHNLHKHQQNRIQFLTLINYGILLQDADLFTVISLYSYFETERYCCDKNLFLIISILGLLFNLKFRGLNRSFHKDIPENRHLMEIHCAKRLHYIIWRENIKQNILKNSNITFLSIFNACNPTFVLKVNDQYSQR